MEAIGSPGSHLPRRVQDLVLCIGSRLSAEDLDALTDQVVRAVCSTVTPTVIEVALPGDVASTGLGFGQLPVSALVVEDDVVLGGIIVWLERGRLSAVELKPSHDESLSTWPGVSSLQFPDDNPLPPEPEALLDDLAAVGVFLSSIWDLVNDPADYPSATPVLLRWLINLEELAPAHAHHRSQSLREGIVRCLMVKSARPIAAPALIDQFRRFASAPRSGLGWVIGAALEVSADDSYFDDLATFILDPTYGDSRQMIVLGLRRMRDPRAASVARQVLTDDGLVSHAVSALGKLRAVEARPDIAALADHPRPFVRKEVRKALKRIDRAHPPM